jgi:CubicO group peptidase (beta-lactamase class C family)
VSFAVEVFSANEDDALFQYFNTAPSVANSTTGVTKVDSNSVWRVASITKLFTTLTFMIEAGDGLWNEPVTKYVPEIAAAVISTNGINHTAWAQVTLGALASHMAGIGRDCKLIPYRKESHRKYETVKQ